MKKVVKNRNINIDIDKLVRLANLPLTDEQKKLFLSQLSTVLDYVSQIQKLPLAHVEETAHVTGQENSYREDEVKPGLSQKEALRNAKQTYNGFFKVPYVFES